MVLKQHIILLIIKQHYVFYSIKKQILCVLTVVKNTSSISYCLTGIFNLHFHSPGKCFFKIKTLMHCALACDINVLALTDKRRVHHHKFHILPLSSLYINVVKIL